MRLCVSFICCTIQVVCSSEKAIFPMMRWHTHKRLLFSMSETVFVPRQSLEWVEENFYLFLIFIICISSHVCTFRVRWGGRDITSLPTYFPFLRFTDFWPRWEIPHGVLYGVNTHFAMEKSFGKTWDVLHLLLHRCVYTRVGTWWLRFFLLYRSWCVHELFLLARRER